VKSGLRKILNQGGPPVPLSTNAYQRGQIFNMGLGKQDREGLMRAYGMSGTVFSIVSLLQQSTASPAWHLYKKQPQDGRRRYTTGDQGSDQRTEVVQHAALSLWTKPNNFHSGFEFREGSNQHLELTGETFWVVDRERAGFPTSMWYIRPDRMEPIPDPDDFLAGWIYTGPNGEQVPLSVDEVILEKLPDPLDPFRGTGPVSSILANIQQQKYATDYQRNLFINGADPGGVITVPNRLTDTQFDELTDRWREAHQGVARAGRVGVLENGATWLPAGQSNKDLEYGQLRLANRDELREAWRIHKSMLGTSDDVNRANAQTAEEVFTGWLTLPRLDRRKDTLNCKLLPMFGASGTGVEFDYDDPSPDNREEDNQELVAKATAAAALVDAGYDPSDVLETVGLPDMDIAIKATQEPAVPPRWMPAPEGAPSGESDDEKGSTDMAALLRRVLSDGYVPVETGRRR
jgi:HK97 family phage portal protein